MVIRQHLLLAVLPTGANGGPTKITVQSGTKRPSFREPNEPGSSHDTAQATQSHAEHQSASGPRSYVVWAAL